MNKEAKMKLFAKLLEGRMNLNLYKRLNLCNIHTDYIGNIEHAFGCAVISTPGYYNLKIDKMINGGSIVFVEALSTSLPDLDNYSNSLINEIVDQINDEICKESPTRYVGSVIVVIAGDRIDFSVVYGFAWEPKSYADGIAEKAIEDAESFLNKLKENAPPSQTASELASAAMAGIESLEDKDSFQLTRDIKKYQHQRLVRRLECQLKHGEKSLDGFSKEKGVPTSGIFNCMRDVEELKETLAYVKSFDFGLFSLYD